MKLDVQRCWPRSKASVTDHKHHWPQEHRGNLGVLVETTSVCVFKLPSLCLCSILQPWRWVCDAPPPFQALFAIIPRIWTHYRTRPNTSAQNQGQAPFWFHTNGSMLIGEKKWLAITAPCSKWRTISPLSLPQVWQNQLLKCIHDTFYVLCSVPTRTSPIQLPQT